MKTEELIAKAEISINAPVKKVWDALINPEKIKQYMFGSTVISDFKEGSEIIFKGEWEGKDFEEKGVILSLQPEKILKYNTFNAQSGKPDTEENYHTITIELSEEGAKVLVSLSQDNNESEKMLEHSEKNWQMMLKDLKKVVEEGKA